MSYLIDIFMHIIVLHQPPSFFNGPIRSLHPKRDMRGQHQATSDGALHLHDSPFLFLAINGISPEFGEREITQPKISRPRTPAQWNEDKTMPCAMEYALYRFLIFPNVSRLVGVADVTFFILLVL